MATKWYFRWLAPPDYIYELSLAFSWHVISRGILLKPAVKYWQKVEKTWEKVVIPKMVCSLYVIPWKEWIGGFLQNYPLYTYAKITSNKNNKKRRIYLMWWKSSKVNVDPFFYQQFSLFHLKISIYFFKNSKIIKNLVNMTRLTSMWNADTRMVSTTCH